MSPDAFTLSLMFGLVGSATLAFGLWQRWREQRPRDWVPVAGTVTGSSTEKRYISRGYEYLTEVEYEYSCNGQSFKSRRIRMSNYSLGTKQAAEAVSARYPVGANVIVLVDPEKPGSAVLEYGATLLSSVCIGLGLLLGAVALLPLLLK
jgi:hypothetical protein